MSLPLLAPFFLAGIGLLVIPWLIHRIRRPHREPVRFSSLLFIPSADKQLLERRRLQHLLLMLLRMAVLLLAALAFSRPFRRAEAPPPVEGPRPVHVLLVDTSYSMGAEGVMEESRTQARSVIDAIPEDEALAVAAFDARTVTLVPFGESSAAVDGNRDSARNAIDALRPGEGHTNFPGALQYAERLIRAAAPGREPPAGVIHLISDLQAGGFPEGDGRAWRLPPGIDVRVYAVGRADAPNRAVADVALRPLPERQMRLLAKIRNWTMPDDAPIEVALNLDGEVRERRTVQVLRNHASQVSFQFEVEPGSAVSGWVELDADALAIDNRRYFAWAPPRPRTVLLIERSSGEEGQGSAWFLRRAIEGGPDSVFAVEGVGPEEALARLGGAGGTPDVVIAGELDAEASALAEALLDYVRQGGRALLTLPGDSFQPAPRLLAAFGLVAGASGEAEAAFTHQLLGWIDFSHPIFLPFQAPRFNDFSTIRVYDAAAVVAEEGAGSANPPARVLARLESGADASGSPALLEVSLGGGVALLWTFPLDADATNFSRSARFAPVVHETLRYLSGLKEETGGLIVGGAPPEWSAEESVELITADGKTEFPGSGAHGEGIPLLTHSGLLRRAAQGGASDTRLTAVNIDASESDPARLDPEAFRLRVVSEAPGASGTPAGADEGLIQPAPGVHVAAEYGPPLLVILLGFLILEFWYAPRLLR